MYVQEMMSRNVVTIDPNDALLRVHDLMTAHQIRHLPVLEDNDLVGIVTHQDLFKACMLSILGVGENYQRAFSHTPQVKDIMSPLMITISPETPVMEAADIIIQQEIGCLPVVVGSRMIGIVTKTDLLRDQHDIRSDKRRKGERPAQRLSILLMQCLDDDRLNVHKR